MKLSTRRVPALRGRNAIALGTALLASVVVSGAAASANTDPSHASGTPAVKAPLRVTPAAAMPGCAVRPSDAKVGKPGGLPKTRPATLKPKDLPSKAAKRVDARSIAPAKRVTIYPACVVGDKGR